VSEVAMPLPLPCVVAVGEASGSALPPRQHQFDRPVRRRATNKFAVPSAQEHSLWPAATAGATEARDDSLKRHIAVVSD
jgi:hypothetical protein